MSGGRRENDMNRYFHPYAYRQKRYPVLRTTLLIVKESDRGERI